MLPALRKNVRTLPTASSSFLQKKTFSVQPPKRFAPEFTPIYATSIKPIKTSNAPPIVKKGLWGYLLTFLGLNTLLTSDDEETEEQTVNNLLELIENKDPKVIMEISQFFISASIPLKQKFFDLLIHKTFGYDILVKIMNNEPQIAPILTSLISEHNISYIYTTFDGRRLITKVIEKDAQSINYFADLVINKLTSLCTSTSGGHFVSNIIELKPTIASTIISHFIQTDSIDSLRVFSTALKYSPYEKTTANYIKNNYDQRNLSSLLAVFIFNQAQSDPEHIIDIPTSTQSLEHIRQNIDHIAQSPLIDKIVKTPEIAQLAIRALSQEKNIAHHNSYVFYHGQSRDYAFLQDLYALLYRAKYGIIPHKDFIFTHLHKPITQEEESSQEEIIREQLVTYNPTDRWKKI